MEADLILRAVALPALGALAALLVAVAFARRVGRRAGSAILSALPMLAVLPAFRALAVQEGGTWSSGLPPAVSYGWLPGAFAVAAAVACAVAAGGTAAAARFASVAAPFAAMSLLSPPGFRGGEAQLGAAAIGSLAAFAASSAGGPSRAGFASWWAVLSLASGFAIVSGFAKLAFIAASLAAASAAFGVVSTVIGSVRARTALDVTFATALACIAFVGMAYDEAPLPRACWAALALSPCVASLGHVPALRTRPRAAATVRFAAPVVAAGLALAAALLAVGTGQTPVDGDPYAAIVAP